VKHGVEMLLDRFGVAAGHRAKRGFIKDDDRPSARQDEALIAKAPDGAGNKVRPAPSISARWP
jgi:hypothetical protein